MDLAYCNCSEAGRHGTRIQQLFRFRLFPATTLDPQTACTFSLLKAAQLLSLQSKLSLYDYYLSIEKLTDATGTTDVNVSRPYGHPWTHRTDVYEGQIQGIPPDATNVAPHQDVKAWRPVL